MIRGEPLEIPLMLGHQDSDTLRRVDHDPHEHERWLDDGGPPPCRCKPGALACCDEPYIPPFASPAQLPTSELPKGDEYGRMITGG